MEECDGFVPGYVSFDTNQPKEDNISTGNATVTKILHTRRMISTQLGQEGVTVRKGRKWLELVEVDEVVDLCICSSDGQQHEIVGQAKVHEIWYGRFYDIPARFVEKESVVESRSYSGELNALCRAYHRDGFQEDDEVVVLAYERISIAEPEEGLMESDPVNWATGPSAF